MQRGDERRFRDDGPRRRVSDPERLEDAGTPRPVRHARDEHCDVLVVGTHGRTGIPRLVLGSVADRVARQSSPCPVLVVHDHSVLEKEEVEKEIA